MSGRTGAHSASRLDRDGPARRLFFALCPDMGFRSQLRTAVAQILTTSPARPQPIEDWHVTLRFLGLVPERLLRSLEQAAGSLEARAFELSFDRLRYWAEPHVLGATAEPAPEAACSLASRLGELARSLGIESDPKPLRPHITLLRGVAPQAVQRLPDPLPPLQVRLLASEFHLVESRPPGGLAPHYRSLMHWKLSP